MRLRLLTTAFVVSLPALVQAAPVDLNGWVENGFHGNLNAGNWTVQGSGNDSVFQSVNGTPTVFFDSGSNAQGKALAGTIKVETTSDDDFVGFVLGYQDGELNTANADFWLIDWKQLDQNYAGPGPAGLALSHISGDTSNAPEGDFWAKNGVATQVQRGANLGSTGWLDNTEYTFELTFTASLIEVKVNGQTEISYAGSFSDGAFGFYNYSQQSVRYAGITEETLPPVDQVPLPASLPLLLAGVGGVIALRRFRIK